MILSCHNVSKSFGENQILKQITFHINDHEHAALIGNNGAGKTTLFSIITGKLDSDSGDISIKKDASIGYLAQHQDFSSPLTVYEELLEAKKDLVKAEEHLRSMEESMKSLIGSELETLMNRYHEEMHTFDLNGGYTYKSDITGILHGLKFSDEDFNKKVATLSGGERTRLLLGRILLCEPDLILLDEPTNYLDISSVEWLENYLLNVKSAVLVVSHDRYFLNRVVNKVIEIENGTSLMYEGNYDDFIVKKDFYKKSLLAAYENQQKEIEHQKEVIATLRSFNREKSIRRADSRQKMLDKTVLIDKPVEEVSDMKLTLNPSFESGNDVLKVEGITKSYGERTLFRNLSFEIKKGEHVAIIGKNGTGKTNILKIINNVIDADEGKCIYGSNVSIGYFDQQSEVLDLNKTIFEEISDTYPSLTNTEIRNVLAAFLFTEDNVFQKISSLSGGERGRVVLAKLMLSGANFLILDEPTNHLDMISKEVLENALNSYTGTVLYVSHDRYFINRTASRILSLHDNMMTEYLGDYDYYLEKSAQLKLETNEETFITTSTTATSEPVKDNSGKDDWKKQKEIQAEKRKLENRLSKIEEQIEKNEEIKAKAESDMLDEKIATSSVKLQEVCNLHAETENLLSALYEEWEEIEEKLSEFN